MTTLLNQSTSHAASAERLKAIYEKRLIPPEKKPFLIDLAASSGPYMAVQDGGLICDGASQIASLGLGFNPGALFGAAQHLESWTNQTSTPHYQAVRGAYEQLMQAKLGSDRYRACFVASGAEANETVLGYLFNQRPDPKRRRVIAFEGSFHGRMMISLASTWNPAKREPFTWPGHESVFAPYPIMEGDDVHAHAEPEGWQELWLAEDDAEFAERHGAMGAGADALLAAEIESLSAVRAAIRSGEALAILIEPMQCEGGDRYSSRRFHQGLALLSQAFDTPLVYDEIQTGFGLGAEFFWHKKFCLQTPDGGPFYPAGVVCAKKAQAGVALVLDPDGPLQPGAATDVEQTSAASVARGYIQAAVIDQFHDAIVEMERDNRERLKALAARHGERISRPRVQGLSFAFDLDSTDQVGKFVAQRFQHGLLYYPAGKKTARFRMNLGFSAADIDLFWKRLEEALDSSFVESDDAVEEPIVSPARGAEPYYRFHERLIDAKLRLLHDHTPPTAQDAVELLEGHLAAAMPDRQFDVVVVTADNWPEYAERVVALQKEVYEPARQSKPGEFDKLFNADDPLSILVLEGERIVANTFAGRLANFDYMPGVPQDAWHDDPTVYYSIDLTIAEGYRGGLGRAMKQAMTLLAMASGVSALHGRNRDRLAGGMLSINLSLGGYTSQWLRHDYPDEGPFRDCLYYRQPTTWRRPPIDLSSGIEAPLGPEHIDAAFVGQNLPVLVNKLTLSNFVTDDFLTHLEGVAEAFPPGLRRLYTASGLSEAVDKIVKVLWRHRQPRTGLLTIVGSDFGAGSFMARSLSGAGEAYFPTDYLPMPGGADDKAFFDDLSQRLASNELLGVFVEPLMRRTMQRVPADVLRRINQLCREHDVPLIYNDTAGMFYRYSREGFGASSVEGLEPHASITSLGGQTAVVAACDDLFIDEPLLLISTWDGDALSLAQYDRAMRHVHADRAVFESTVAAFESKFAEATGATLSRGVGGVNAAALSGPITKQLRQSPAGDWLVCPSYSEMLRFNAADLSAEADK
ncbi:MAG: aminotransferase class III-fold pyridoxal phosphate-dependent enzyme [Planctomycetota bacterium]